MTMLYQVSSALLWAIVVLQAFVLMEILRRTVRMKRLHLNSRSKLQKLFVGERAPEFTGRVLGTDGLLRRSKLRGHTTRLLFVSPKDASSPLYTDLSVAIHAMWHAAKGNLYLICTGGEDACRQIVRDHRIDGLEHGRVPVVLDETGEIARRFFVNSTPQGVTLDERLRIARYGRPVPTEEPRHAESDDAARLA
jgi:hypothetical protein